ncbi:PREDICTED: binder of sperm protein homolog 2-like isoform X4 [Hipposideros armiger]|uniref:Binder of sperm protein homolog 2-like isoform X4 n=1 Tax=Hipposideros armiger TaxID=186990 RepID=A0A8B7SM00_HIPAR|nr:PREDICTED: binder of sperm protein homolog 2-like isoform X4 [Hipposideros armiger]
MGGNGEAGRLGVPGSLYAWTESRIYCPCTPPASSYDWCSLDKNFQGRWRYCTGKDPPVCIFPFVFKKKYFHRCTKESYILNRSWCSLTKNYNEDRKWKQCSPYNF